MDKCREEFLKQHSSKVLKIVKFDESKNGFVLHDHLGLTDINLSALAEINYGWTLWQHQQAKLEELEGRNQLLSESTLEMGSKHIRDTDLINQQASTLFRLREFIYGSGDLREYSDEELLEHQRILKVILAGEQALKGESNHRVVEGFNPYTTFESDQ